MIRTIGQKAALSIRHHLHLVPALALSAGVHYGLVYYWPQPAQKNVVQGELQSPLEIVLVRQPNSFQHLDAKTAIKTQVVNHSENIQENVSTASAKTTTERNAKTDTDAAYLSPKDVEMPALPIVNIDLSMLSGDFDSAHLQQSLPIQLRLYIDEFGQVVRVERIGMVLAQDETMANALEESLKNVKFTPAKRAALEVKSYQEVAFDFKKNFE